MDLQESPQTNPTAKASINPRTLVIAIVLLLCAAAVVAWNFWPEAGPSQEVQETLRMLEENPPPATPAVRGEPLPELRGPKK